MHVVLHIGAELLGKLARTFLTNLNTPVVSRHRHIPKPVVELTPDGIRSGVLVRVKHVTQLVGKHSLLGYLPLIGGDELIHPGFPLGEHRGHIFVIIEVPLSW